MELRDRVRGCLLGALVGDAMGTPSENLSPEEIRARWGWIDDFEGVGTDDTILRHLLCEALIETEGRAGPDDWARQWVANREVILVQRRNKFFLSALHTAQKLSQGYPARHAAEGNMPSSTTAMAIAPVGIVHAGDPEAAAGQAQRLASLMHTGPVAFCQDAAAAIAAATAAALAEESDVDRCLAAAVGCLEPGAEEMRDLIESALDMAGALDYEAFRSGYAPRFARAIRCDSRETVPAALALCRLAGGDPVRVIEYGANLGGDTDTIATMAGGICGALRGRSALRPAWIEKAEAEGAPDCAGLADRLIEVALILARRQLARSRELLRRWGEDA